MRKHGLEHIRAAVKLVALKGTRADLDAYASLLVAIAERVAQVYPDTGKRVTPAERIAVAEVRAAAGLGESGCSRCGIRVRRCAYTVPHRTPWAAAGDGNWTQPDSYAPPTAPRTHAAARAPFRPTRR